MYFRPALASDASEIATIHTRSWQLHYRGLASNTDAIGFYNHLGARQGRSEMLSLAGNKVEALMMWWPLSKMAGWE